VTLDGGVPDAAAYPEPDSGVIQGGQVDGGLPYSECQALCGAGVYDCTVQSYGPPGVISCQFLCLGRRPEGFAGEGACGETDVGAHFAQAAQLEAASVPAFRRMAKELASHGAPRRLVKGAERAAREEVKHARGAAALAKRYGARPAGFEASVTRARSLEELAIENAIEGCVRETYGALVATWQAREAKDPSVRAHMQRIAKEETSHAALAWKTDAWARGKLTKAARARVEAAKANALTALVHDVSRMPIDAATARVAGLPSPRDAARLASGLATLLT
jgi:hypothetical protein